MDSEKFRSFVLEVLGEEFPEHAFLPGQHANVVRWNESEFGLYNLQTETAHLEFGDRRIRSIVVEYFGRMIKMVEIGTSMVPNSWEEAKPRVRLQLMPAKFRLPNISVTYPFLDDLFISVVVDADHGYAYVREEDLRKWSMSSIDLYEIARENLAAASQGLNISYVPGPPALIALETRDSYDAARILLPELREFAASKLGSPFLAGIPNRDFLILWPASAPHEFQLHVRRQISADSHGRSHPLTPQILSATVDSIVPENNRMACDE